MIFQKTLFEVLGKNKTQTSRIWKDNYVQSFISSESNLLRAVYTHHEKQPFNRILYEVGQVRSVQPARGKKGIARICILELAKRDVRNFDALDIANEGFDTRLEFYKVWTAMHFPAYLKLLEDGYVTSDWWLDSIRAQVASKWTALVLNFELIKE